MGIFDKLFKARPKSKRELIISLAQKRSENDPKLRGRGDVSALPDEILLGLPEATIVTIVETYCILKKHNIQDQEIFTKIEEHRSAFSEIGTLPKSLNLSNYIKYRLALEHGHGFPIGEDHIDASISAALNFFGGN